MAIVKFGGIVTGLRGSVGGSTFRGYRGRSVMYNKQTSRTGRQAINGGNPNNLGKYGNLWRSIIVDQRSNWGSLTKEFQWIDKNGNIYEPNGWQLFIDIVSKRRKFGNMDLTTDNYTKVIDSGFILAPDVFANGALLTNVSAVGATNQVIISVRKAGTQVDRNPEVQTKQVDALTLVGPNQYATDMRANGFKENLYVGDRLVVQYRFVNDWGYSEIVHTYNVDIQ